MGAPVMKSATLPCRIPTGCCMTCLSAEAKGNDKRLETTSCGIYPALPCALADGIVDEQGTRRCSRLRGVELANADDWAALDVVMTLRAILMATRLELMFNTDVFLGLQQFDPMEWYSTLLTRLAPRHVCKMTNAEMGSPFASTTVFLALSPASTITLAPRASPPQDALVFVEGKRGTTYLGSRIQLGPCEFADSARTSASSRDGIRGRSGNFQDT
ncbi:hypothetical protein B0H16DRAFT_1467856 [Mycena metata]|uniref:Uncharacterized protein n=1 Tax=Mycena metata TaxID=1033252 RepID=A0AAD7I4K6_9AGAR|nr:hypothetical protein B0H16DRAFT_1467856 [Mycena metata]